MKQMSANSDRHETAPAGSFARILVVVDPTADSHPCIDKAARVALSCRSELEMYICDGDQDAEPEIPDRGLARATPRAVIARTA